MNLVECFFRDLTDKRIRRGVFRSIDSLHQAISDYIENHNAEPKPFIWTAKAEDILEKVLRARKVLDKSQQVGRTILELLLLHLRQGFSAKPECNQKLHI